MNNSRDASSAGRPSLLTNESSQASPCFGPAEKPLQASTKLLDGMDSGPPHIVEPSTGSSFEAINLECAEPMNLSFLCSREEEKGKDQGAGLENGSAAGGKGGDASRRFSVPSAFVEVGLSPCLCSSSW